MERALRLKMESIEKKMESITIKSKKTIRSKKSLWHYGLKITELVC